MDRIGRDRLRRRRLGERLAGEVRRDPADDLDEAGASSVDDSRLTEDVELLARLLDCFVASADEVREELV